MISKIALTLVIISSMPVHASLGQTLLKGPRIILQGVGNNPGRLAAVVGGLAAIVSLRGLAETYRENNECIDKIRSLSATSCTECNESRNNEIGRAKSVIAGAWLTFPIILCGVTSLEVGLSYGFAKACGYFGSKI